MKEIECEKLYNILNCWNKNDLINYIIDNINKKELKDFLENE